MLDFYTIETTVDLLNNENARKALITHIGYYCQPEIVGTPYSEPVELEGDITDVYYLRFAIRKNGLLDLEKDFIKTLKLHFGDDVSLHRVKKL